MSCRGGNGDCPCFEYLSPAAGLRDCGTAGLSPPHPYFCKKISTGHFFVCSWFPSGFFLSDACLACRIEGASSNGEHIEFYPLDALTNFLFSPIGHDSKQAKLDVLARMQHYFSSNIYRRIYFMPMPQDSRLKDPCMHISAGSGQVVFLFPGSGDELSFVEVNNQAFSDTLYKHYYEGVSLVQDGLNLLDIAQKTLLLDEFSKPHETLRFFYQQCVLRTSCSEWIKACFTPEVQQYLDGV
jgi:hypothetical protein